ncbi:PRD domain-containing protein [Erysipelothrix rhusiopathiae]|uniref:BglG family transcription antiterminator n=1 Tax=Erysipelothrix rhusiopathiae TaxID=1648 RepID=UPI0023B1001C|nr:PRD domain-containing protein [Erysipelothrix rhusiopathiae]MDE8070798.1 PRD domain-containing protein [Erysipelothrix rhusiopathiae]MDE8071617.1 PRD domain-containing protein [Erysipelothrix rhusiopathiae]MDE8118850.1 PRD domain-containing protein [Erysipelothrix rhusiopathiae]MDE8132281.1 PRD domain-containing protein [Erysipelothrix rhusiopathiae]
MELTQRQNSILLLIINAHDAITSDDIATELNISSKTVQREVQAIDSILKKRNMAITSLRGKGYLIDDSHKNEMWKTYFYNDEFDNNVLPNVRQSRVEWIIRKIANGTLNGTYFTLEALADNLFISLSTLKRDLVSVRRILREYHIFLENDYKRGLVLTGDENSIRRLINDYLVLEKSTIDINRIIGQNTPRMDIIERIIVTCIQKYQLHLTDIGFKNLSIHIEIALTRIEQGKLGLSNTTTSINTDSNAYLCAEALAVMLEEALTLKIPESEIINIYIHLSSQKKLHTDIDNINSESHHNLQILNEALDDIYRIYGSDFRHDEILKQGLMTHLESALKRIELGLSIRNELLDEIEKNYPFEIQIAKVLAFHFLKTNAIAFNLDEVGFLALHFCGARERARQDEKSETTRAIVVCTTGVGTAMLLKAKLESQFGDALEIKKVSALYQLDKHDMDDVDLLISTVHIDRNLGVPTVVVSAIVTDRDIAHIKRYIKGNPSNSHSVADLFDEKLFIVNPDTQSPQELLEMMSQKALTLGYIDKACQESIIEREALGSTEVGNLVCIPHNIEGSVYRPSIVVCVLDKPIPWKYDHIQLILMILIDQDHRTHYSDLFAELYSEIDHQYKVSNIIRNKNIAYMKSLFNE